MNPVTAGTASDVENGVADAGSAGEKDVLSASDSEREGVDQNVAIVARVESGLAPYCGNADTIAVVTDASDDAVDQMSHARRRDLTET